MCHSDRSKTCCNIWFRDRPRSDGKSFVEHLGPSHRGRKVVLLSGDRQEGVAYLAVMVGVKEIYADKTTEEKLAIVEQETHPVPFMWVMGLTLPRQLWR